MRTIAPWSRMWRMHRPTAWFTARNACNVYQSSPVSCARVYVGAWLSAEATTVTCHSV